MEASPSRSGRNHRMSLPLSLSPRIMAFRNANREELTAPKFEEVSFTNDNFTEEESMIAVDYTENFDPDINDFHGQGVMMSEAIGCDLCFLCGSGGKGEMLRCQSCCIPVHPYCIEQVITFITMHPVRILYLMHIASEHCLTLSTYFITIVFLRFFPWKMGRRIGTFLA